MENSQNLKKRKEAGQGLSEYALILVLVALVVIAILALIGPAIGNVFSNVIAVLDPSSNGGTIPTPGPQWTFCANENDHCSFSGTATVRYGANNTYYTLVLTDGTPCNNAVFGDPLIFVNKHCDVFQ